MERVKKTRALTVTLSPVFALLNPPFFHLPQPDRDHSHVHALITPSVCGCDSLSPAATYPWQRVALRPSPSLSARCDADC